MRNFTKRIGIYTFVAIIILMVFMAVPGYKTEVTPLGNVLSAYFYNKHTNVADLYPEYQPHIASVTDYNLKKFYKKLYWKPKSTIVDFKSDIDATWQLYDTKGEAKTNYLQYWQTIRSEVRDFYHQTITPVDVAIPVVHFRCSDAPFVTHPLYHLTKASTVQWMIDKVKDSGYSEVIMLSCNKHRRVKNNRCTDYQKFYIDMFHTSGIKVTTQCHDVYTDFALMVYSPLLVSLNESSFAFLAGVSKDPNHYISCNLGREYKGQYLLQNQADWHMANIAPLLHSDINDYNDVEYVKAQLRN